MTPLLPLACRGMDPEAVTVFERRYKERLDHSSPWQRCRGDVLDCVFQLCTVLNYRCCYGSGGGGESTMFQEPGEVVFRSLNDHVTLFCGDVSYASLIQTALSVCSQVNLFE